MGWGGYTKKILHGRGMDIVLHTQCEEKGIQSNLQLMVTLGE